VRPSELSRAIRDHRDTPADRAAQLLCLGVVKGQSHGTCQLDDLVASEQKLSDLDDIDSCLVREQGLNRVKPFAAHHEVKVPVTLDEIRQLGQDAPVTNLAEVVNDENKSSIRRLASSAAPSSTSPLRTKLSDCNRPARRNEPLR